MLINRSITDNKSSLKKFFYNYIKNKKINKKYEDNKYFDIFLKIVDNFSNYPFLTQNEILNKLNISNKEDLLFLNDVIRNSELSQDLILKTGIGKKYWNTIIPFAKETENNLKNIYNFPKRIALFPGVSCMFYCGFCGRDQSQKYPTNILQDSKKTFENLFSQIPSYTALSISGGLEPLTNPNIGEIISSAKKYNIRVPLITNGYSLTENFIKKNPGIWDLDSLRVSLYGVDKESYKFITRLDKSYEIVKKNAISFLKLRNIHNKKLKFGFNFIIIPENLDQICKILDLIKEINQNVDNGEGVNFLTLRDDYQSVTGNDEKFDDKRKYKLSTKMDKENRNKLIEKISEFKRYKSIICKDLHVDFGYSLEALSNEIFDEQLIKVPYQKMRNYGFTQMSVAIDLFGDVFLFREAGFLNRSGNKKFIIGRITKDITLENIIRKFLNKGEPILFKYQDERFMDSFDHVLTKLVNQAEEDNKYGIPFIKGPVILRSHSQGIELGNNWYSDRD